MGLRRALRLVDSVDRVEAAGVPLPAPQIGSQTFPGPFPQDRTSINAIVWNDLTGGAVLPCTRSQAMSVPAIAKARHVVAPKVAGYPLTALREDTPVTPQPTWTYRTDDGVSPWHRMVWTVDDLIFTGWSLWAVSRGADGVVLNASRIGRDRWSFGDNGEVLIDKAPVTNARDVVLIPGPHEGICTFGTTTIRHAMELLANAAVAGRVGAPQIDLHYTGDTQLDDETIDSMIQRWVDARLGRNGGVGFTNKLVEARELGRTDPALLVEGRNAAAVDCARLVGVAAGMIDATAPKASLNYETQAGRGLEHTEYGVDPYMEAIEARLSMDDVVPRGQRIAFDRTRDTETPIDPTGPAVED